MRKEIDAEVERVLRAVDIGGQIIAGEASVEDEQFYEGYDTGYANAIESVRELIRRGVLEVSIAHD